MRIIQCSVKHIPSAPGSQSKISKALGTLVIVKDLEGNIVNKFLSKRACGKHYNVSEGTIRNYVKSGIVFQGKYILSSSCFSSI